MSFVNQRSEIGKLNTVMLHRPGVEIDSISPDYLKEMLVEDILFLPSAQKEHDEFANVLRGYGVEVLYLEDLFCESILDEALKLTFINDYIHFSGVQGAGVQAIIYDYLSGLSVRDLFHAVCRGITYKDLAFAQNKPIRLTITDPYPFVTDPVPNAYFSRDVAITVANGMIVSCMSMPSRKRETLFVRYIHHNHPRFTAEPVPLWYDYHTGYEIEGGDVLVLSDKVLAIGCGERTSVNAVECVAKNLFENGYEHILLFNNPKSRKFMHLDVLCTMIDYDKFLVHPCIADKYFEVYDVTKKNGRINAEITTEPVAELLKKMLKLPAVQFIEVGGGDPVVAAREHWNMGSNSLTISPGNIITYDRNEVTNDLLVKAGIKVNAICGSELSRGRGGPRCMSMPINREDVW